MHIHLSASSSSDWSQPLICAQPYVFSVTAYGLWHASFKSAVPISIAHHALTSRAGALMTLSNDEQAWAGPGSALAVVQRIVDPANRCAAEILAQSSVRDPVTQQACLQLALLFSSLASLKSAIL